MELINVIQLSVYLLIISAKRFVSFIKLTMFFHLTRSTAPSGCFFCLAVRNNKEIGVSKLSKNPHRKFNSIINYNVKINHQVARTNGKYLCKSISIKKKEVYLQNMDERGVCCFPPANLDVALVESFLLFVFNVLLEETRDVLSDGCPPSTGCCT